MRDAESIADPLGGAEDPRDRLARAADDFYRRGWMAGTAGNLSLRQDDGTFWITASGKAKGALGRLDFLRIAPDGSVVERGREEDRPSAETCLHAALYAFEPSARACYHVHSVPAVVAARTTADDDLLLPPIEMIKGFGIWEESPRVTVPVFPNHASVPCIATEMQARFAASAPRVPGFLIRDHGLTVWADSPERAVHHLELFDFLFGCLVAARASNVHW
jgi:methylthioribulose-1-phosphate dehydratase